MYRGEILTRKAKFDDEAASKEQQNACTVNIAGETK
jgi:hypothetical protein